MSIRTLTLSVLLCLTFPSLADEASDTAQPPAAQPDRPDKDDDRVCRIENVTGSMIPKRICTTRAERREMEERTQAWRRESQRGPIGGVRHDPG